MKSAIRYGLMGFCAGLGLASAALVAHSHHSAHGAPPDLLALSGSPAQLAERSQRFADHVCAVIEADASCTLQPLAQTAARELSALQPDYEHRQRQLHAALLQQPTDRQVVDALRSAQAATLEQATLRYTALLLDSADQLTAEQKRRFDHHRSGQH